MLLWSQLLLSLMSRNFNQILQATQSYLSQTNPNMVRQARYDALFVRAYLFIKTMVIYLIALVFLGWSFLRSGRWAYGWSWLLMLGGWALHSSGLLIRMVLDGRPPVTNLYSSAVFVGWGVVGMGLLLSRRFQHGTLMVAAIVMGVLSLVVAHHLSTIGDTMPVMQAVLDTNFWLATHVVIITMGYSAMLLAAFTAVMYVLRGVLTSSLSLSEEARLYRVTLGVVSIGLVCSFLGTMLGGIWADQSWGRFWGWDPKENGALMIVLWGAIMLHARLAGVVHARGFLTLAIGGGMVTIFSWFGVNMLGVGLHSYGFIERSLTGYIASNVFLLVVMAGGCLPRRYWRSRAGLSVLEG